MNQNVHEFDPPYRSVVLDSLRYRESIKYCQRCNQIETASTHFPKLVCNICHLGVTEHYHQIHAFVGKDGRAVDTIIRHYS